MEVRNDSFANSNSSSSCLQIYRSNRKCGKITGNDEIILFCSQIEDKNDIEVEFVQYESRPLASSLVSSSIAATTAAITSPSLASSQSHIFPSLDQSGRIIKWKELAFVDRDNIHANSVLIIRTPPYTCISPVESKLSQLSNNHHHHHLHHHQHHHHHHGRHSDYSRFFTKYNNKIKSKVEKVHYRLYRPSTGHRSEDWVFFYWLSESSSSSPPPAYAATALNQLHFLDTCCMFGAIYPDDNLKEQLSPGANNNNSNNSNHFNQQHSIMPPPSKEEHSHSRSNSFRIVTGTLTKLFNKNNEKIPMNESSNYESIENSADNQASSSQPVAAGPTERSNSPRFRANEPVIAESSEHQSDSHHYRQPSSSATTTTTSNGWQGDPHDSPNQSKKNMKKARSNSILLDKILLIDTCDRANALKKSRTTTSFHHATVDRLSNQDKKSTSFRNNLNEQVVNENSEVNSNTSSCTLVNKSPTKLRFDQVKSLPNGTVHLSINEPIEVSKRSKDGKRRNEATTSMTKPGKHKKCVIL